MDSKGYFQLPQQYNCGKINHTQIGEINSGFWRQLAEQRNLNKWTTGISVSTTCESGTNLVDHRSINRNGEFCESGATNFAEQSRPIEHKWSRPTDFPLDSNDEVVPDLQDAETEIVMRKLGEGRCASVYTLEKNGGEIFAVKVF